mmetsp:Transcript_7460/g.12647  ORF Transcript_7460/g.12647 Transcript_7460/m.12647 type:complete len:113 (+) Transcript_7460:109-447(+)
MHTPANLAVQIVHTALIFQVLPLCNASQLPSFPRAKKFQPTDVQQSFSCAQQNGEGSNLLCDSSCTRDKFGKPLAHAGVTACECAFLDWRDYGLHLRLFRVRRFPAGIEAET